MVSICKDLFAKEKERRQAREDSGETDLPIPYLLHTTTIQGTVRMILESYLRHTCVSPFYQPQR